MSWQYHKTQWDREEWDLTISVFSWCLIILSWYLIATKGGLHTNSVGSGHFHIVLPVPCATRLRPKATSEQMGSSMTGKVVLQAAGESKNLSSTIPVLSMTCIMVLCNLTLKENLNKIIFCFFFFSLVGTELSFSLSLSCCMPASIYQGNLSV